MTIKTTLFIVTLSFTSITSADSSANDFKVCVHGQGQPILLIPDLSNAAAVWDSTVDQYQDNYEPQSTD